VNREAFEVVRRKAQALRARLFSLRRIPTQQSVWHPVRHIGRWIWIFLQHIASIAADIAKFLHHVLKRIRELYDKYIRLPFRRLNEWLSNIENKQEVKVKERLNKKSLDD